MVHKTIRYVLAYTLGQYTHTQIILLLFINIAQCFRNFELDESHSYVIYIYSINTVVPSSGAIVRTYEGVLSTLKYISHKYV